MKRLLVAAAATVAVGAGGLTVAVARDGRAPTPAGTSQRAVWTGPTPITAEQQAFRDSYFAAIRAGDPAVTECGCTAGTRAKDRARKIAADRAATSAHPASTRP